MATDTERCIFRAFGQDFILNKHFHLTGKIGRGSHSLICSSTYTELNEETHVAIRKIPNAFGNKLSCKRTLRELKLLRHLRGHPNIAWLFDTDIVFYPNGALNGVYLYEELMECDLSQIIRSEQRLEDAHFQSFIYQILCALKYIHSANVLHCDLKPKNLLVNSDCQLKICNFGLSCSYSENHKVNDGSIKGYITSIWYKAPEILLNYQECTKAVDIWSTGCILAELLGRKPMFEGKDYVDHLNHILQILGTPPEETLQEIASQKVYNYIFQFGNIPGRSFESILPGANPEALELLKKMLEFDPKKRITVEDALEHPYLSMWHDINEEFSCQKTFGFEFEHIESMAELGNEVIKEVFDFRKVVRKHPISGDSPSSSLSLEDAIPQEVVQVHPSRKVLPSYSPEFSYVSQLPSLTTTQPYQNLMGISSNSFQGVNEKENTFKQDTKHENSELLNGPTEPNITKMGPVSSSPPGHDINVNDGTNQNTNEDDSDFFFDLEKELELFRR